MAFSMDVDIFDAFKLLKSLSLNAERMAISLLQNQKAILQTGDFIIPM